LNGIFSLGLTGGLLAPATLGYLAAWLDDIAVVMSLPLLGTGLVCALLLLICASGAALSQSRAGLSGRIRALIDSTPSLAGALWGIQISDAGNGEVVYQHN